MKKSTKQTDRNKAMAVCLEFEKASQKAREGTLTEVQARRVISEIVESTTGEPVEFYTVRQWCEDWLSGKSLTKATNIHTRYSKVIADFLVSLGRRADLNIAHIAPRDIKAFRDSEIKQGKGPTTCNLSVKTVRAAFNAARRQVPFRSAP